MRAGAKRNRRPFWLPASNYYVLAVAISTAVFFLIWGILRDEGDDTPWITAGVSASTLLCIAAILREVILRRARHTFLNQKKSMDSFVHGVKVRIGDQRHHNKLTLERNAAILGEIKKKSEAAKVLNKFSAGHREVFELCGQYMSLVESEMKTISADSPRLAPLLKGRSSAAEKHKYHLLSWAEIEARSLTGEVKNLASTTKKVEAAQNALSVIESALGSYPSEASLLQSQELLREMVVSIKVSGWVERAERAEFKGDYEKAKDLYRDALYYLDRDEIRTPDRLHVAERINSAIERVMLLESGKSH